MAGFRITERRTNDGGITGHERKGNATRRFKRDLEELKEEHDETQRMKKLNAMLEDIQYDLEE